MELKEFLTKLNENGISDELIEEYYKIFEESSPDNFNHPVVRNFIKAVNNLPYDARIQDVINYMVRYMTSKGVEVPCMSGCSDDCVFHELEEKNN